MYAAAFMFPLNLILSRKYLKQTQNCHFTRVVIWQCDCRDCQMWYIRLCKAGHSYRTLAENSISNADFTEGTPACSNNNFCLSLSSLPLYTECTIIQASNKCAQLRNPFFVCLIGRYIIKLYCLRLSSHRDSSFVYPTIWLYRP